MAAWSAFAGGQSHGSVEFPTGSTVSINFLPAGYILTATKRALSGLYSLQHYNRCFSLSFHLFEDRFGPWLKKKLVREVLIGRKKFLKKVSPVRGDLCLVDI